MTEESKDAVKVSDMLRFTAQNTTELFQRIAGHIDNLESEVLKLQERIKQLEGEQDDFK